MGPNRFKSRNATPPCGYYEYSLGGVTITDRSRIGITTKANALRVEKGLGSSGDPFIYVMEYMCPFLPSGFCVSPSNLRLLQAPEVKKKSSELFSARSAANDEIERRLEACIVCPKHTTKGFCLSCTGLLDWIYRGFSGRRKPLPADQATGVCLEEGVLIAVSATVAEQPPDLKLDYPLTCWRRASAAEAK